jgi:hypothetical protein
MRLGPAAALASDAPREGSGRRQEKPLLVALRRYSPRAETKAIVTPRAQFHPGVRPGLAQQTKLVQRGEPMYSSSRKPSFQRGKWRFGFE